MSSLQLVDYQEKVMKELVGLSFEKIDEVVDFIGYLKAKEAGKKRKKKARSGIQDNPLLSVIGIGESEPPHNLAESHDKYAYGRGSGRFLNQNCCQHIVSDQSLSFGRKLLDLFLCGLQ